MTQSPFGSAPDDSSSTTNSRSPWTTALPRGSTGSVPYAAQVSFTLWEQAVYNGSRQPNPCRYSNITVARATASGPITYHQHNYQHHQVSRLRVRSSSNLAPSAMAALAAEALPSRHARYSRPAGHRRGSYALRYIVKHTASAVPAMHSTTPTGPSEGVAPAATTPLCCIQRRRPTHTATVRAIATRKAESWLIVHCGLWIVRYKSTRGRGARCDTVPHRPVVDRV